MKLNQIERKDFLLKKMCDIPPIVFQQLVKKGCWNSYEEKILLYLF